MSCNQTSTSKKPRDGECHEVETMTGKLHCRRSLTHVLLMSRKSHGRRLPDWAGLKAVEVLCLCASLAIGLRALWRIEAQVLELQVDLKAILERTTSAPCPAPPVDVEDVEDEALPVPEGEAKGVAPAPGCLDVVTTGLSVECQQMTWGNCWKGQSAAAIRAMCASLGESRWVKKRGPWSCNSSCDGCEDLDFTTFQEEDGSMSLRLNGLIECFTLSLEDIH